MEFASVPSEHREIRLKEWISRYSDDVLRTCFVLLSDRTLAEDATQDTFLKAWKSMEQFEGRHDASPKTWSCASLSIPARIIAARSGCETGIGSFD